MRSCRLTSVLLLVGLTVGGLTLGSGPSPGPEPLAGPTIVSTVPASESLQVLTTAIIQITFSTPMNESTVNGSVIVRPRTGPDPALNYSWAANDSLFVTPVGGLVNCTTYTVLVFAGKDLNGTDLVSGPVPNPWRFMTWCDKPFILSTIPRDGEIGVRNNTDIVVRFSIPVDCTSTRPRMSNVVPPIRGSGNDLCSSGNTVWTFTLTNGAQFLPNTTYAITISAQDPNGSALVPGLAANPFNFTVNAAPWISVPTLSATGCLDGSTTISISWTMTDQEDSATSLTVLLSFWNNQSQWETITGPRQGFPSSASTPWMLPRTDVTTRVRLEVTDSGGVTNVSESVGFRIDTGPPAVGSTDPRDGARGVATNSTISVSFYEEMDQPTVEAAISVVPAVPTPRFSWLTPNVIEMSTGGLLDNTTYTVTVARTARDTCGPGRTMLADYIFSFTTARPRPSVVRQVSVVNVDDSSVTLTWEPVTTFVSGAQIPPGTVVWYRVTRSTNESAPETELPRTSDLRLTDRGLPSSTHFIYRVYALVDNESSLPSAPVPVDTRAPFFGSPAGGIFLIVLLAGIVAAVLVAARLRQQQKQEEADDALASEIRQIVEQIRRVRSEADPKARRATEEALQSHFRTMVSGDEEGEAGPADPRLEGLYRALAKALIQSPEVNVAHGRKIVDTRLGRLAEILRRQGAAYRLLSEAEASVDSELFQGLPESARKALVLVYFYALEEYLSHRLRALVPPGATLLLGERGHINVRRRGWEAQWSSLTLGNLLYLMEHNAHFFVANTERWEERALPWLRETVEARNRTAHPSREAPPLERVRELVYRAVPLVEAVLKKPQKPAKS